MEIIDNFLSIIIPIYNAEKYLSECLNSIIQPMEVKNYEIILINDGSTDGSEKICKEYATNDSRIRYFSQKNKGVSVARNLGIKKSTGNYILFVDADDFIESKILKEFLKSFKKIDADIIIMKALKYFSKNKIVPIDGEINLENNHNNLITISKLNKFPGSACSKIIKKEVLNKNNIKFSENIVNFEDIEFMIRFYCKSNIIKANNSPFYYYRQTKEDSASKNLTKKNFDSMIKVIKNNADKNPLTDESFYTNCFLAYEYCVLLFNYASLSTKQKKLNKNIFELQWILKYDNNPRVRIINKLVKVFGIRITVFLLRILCKLKK